jgi:hypothetical protein
LSSRNNALATFSQLQPESSRTNALPAAPTDAPQIRPRQSDQVGAVDRRQEAWANHDPKTNPKIEAWQATFRILNDSGYASKRCELRRTLQHQ